MKIRRRNQFKDESYMRHLDCCFWIILSHMEQARSGHIDYAESNSFIGQTEIRDNIYNRLVLIRLDGITPLLTWHKTLLISKSLECKR